MFTIEDNPKNCLITTGRSENQGRWTDAEHDNFLIGVSKCQNNWKQVREFIPTRNPAQIRSHAQKFVIKVEKRLALMKNNFNKNITPEEVEVSPLERSVYTILSNRSAEDISPSSFIRTTKKKSNDMLKHREGTVGSTKVKTNFDYIIDFAEGKDEDQQTRFNDITQSIINLTNATKVILCDSEHTSLLGNKRLNAIINKSMSILQKHNGKEY